MSKKNFFLEGVDPPKSPKNTRNALSDAPLMSRFQNFAADAAKKNHAPRNFLKTALRAVLIILFINELSRTNLRPKILRSCFLYWQESFVVLVRCLNLPQTSTSCTPDPPTPRHYQNRSLGAANLPITCHHDVSLFYIMLYLVLLYSYCLGLKGLVCDLLPTFECICHGFGGIYTKL